MTKGRIHRESPTPTPSATYTGVRSSGLPPDLLQEASKRLGWAALIYSGTFFLAVMGPHLFRVSVDSVGQVGIWDRPFQMTVSFVSIGLGIAVFLLTRFSKLRPEVLLDIGLVFEVVGAFGISVSSGWGMFSEWDPAVFENFFGIPWECVWIVFFPLLAPNTPGKTLIASVAAASTGLLMVLLSKAAGATSPEAPMSFFFVYYLFTTYLCAGIAFLLSKTIYQFGKRYGKLQEIGSYQLVKPLGRGGMGEVWMARHRMLARPAAIKLIRPEALGKDPVTQRTAVRRFEREAQATACLESYHTIDLYDFGVTNEGAFYYVMELLRGVNLDTLVKKFGPLPPERAIFLLRQVCHSLGEAHACGMIHRDIKPANVYVCRLGPEYDFVKVLDFGLVKTREGGAVGGTELTAEGLAAGTPAYMAPEMALGKQEIDGRADIYGLGCVGYWLLTGQRVFVGDTPLSTVVAHVQEKPIPPSQRTELEVPDSLERIILSCLEKDPADRPQSAGELDELLAACKLAQVWGIQNAKAWWTLHIPEPEIPLGEEVADESPQDILTVKH
jgi:serine/threonine-protein kinase